MHGPAAMGALADAERCLLGKTSFSAVVVATGASLPSDSE